MFAFDTQPAPARATSVDGTELEAYGTWSKVGMRGKAGTGQKGALINGRRGSTTRDYGVHFKDYVTE